MPSKFRKAIGAVKDQTSISLAKVYTNNGTKSNLEVTILKATRHDEAPIDDRQVKELLNQISSSKVHSAACAQLIGKRIGKTRNWIVALKSLMLVLRIFQDGDPYFPREVVHAMKRGAKILNLSTFRDDSHSSPWDYTAFVRTFALYLDDRLDCSVRGKLQKKFNKRNGQPRMHDPLCEMKPAVLLDKMSYWQKLLDRAMGTRPTGTAKTNKLVKTCLYAVVQETFDLYRDISDGLALLLDSFFHLQYQFCVNAFQSCVKASNQFEELSSFYDLCKSIGVGRTSEYPSIQKISEELIVTLQEFLKDQASFPNHARSLTHSHIPTDPSSSCDDDKKETEHNRSRCVSLEDLMTVTDTATSCSTSMGGIFDQFDKQSSDSDSSKSLPNDQGTLSSENSILDLVSLEDWPPGNLEDEHEQEQVKPTTPVLDPGMSNQSKCWEIVLVESANQPAPELENAVNGYESSAVNIYIEHQQYPTNVSNATTDIDLFDQASLPQNDHYNPFLQDNIEVPMVSIASNDQLVPSNDERVFPIDEMYTITSNDERVFPIDDMFPAAPTFHATPTFSVKDDEKTPAFPTEAEAEAEDPFGMSNGEECNNGMMDQQMVMHEQQLWLQNQDKIIAKHFA
ncbi:clathrin coat assembly protein AP180 [Euphorbia lathyris]|uniref:clathrin coat assembly protein AP180 n=1 Tax=Euphorbia lathyris TaxID=212925 RepID=UPI0033137DC9